MRCSDAKEPDLMQLLLAGRLFGSISIVSYWMVPKVNSHDSIISTTGVFGSVRQVFRRRLHRSTGSSVDVVSELSKSVESLIFGVACCCCLSVLSIDESSLVIVGLLCFRCVVVVRCVVVQQLK